jgi:enamine deaminase RidA (YjgF/YER057c/UK114 family)
LNLNLHTRSVIYCNEASNHSAGTSKGALNAAGYKFSNIQSRHDGQTNRRLFAGGCGHGRKSGLHRRPGRARCVSNFVGKDDFRAQVEQVFKNLKAAVEAARGNFHDVIKLNFYCVDSVDPSQIPLVREVRDKYVNTQNPPTSTFVVVRRLVRPEWLIEVEAVAIVNR